MNELTTIKSIVRNILDKDEKARNSDTWLILEVLRELGFNVHINEEDMSKMPSFESITRCRRLFQEKGKYLATERIKEQREVKEVHYKNMFTNSHLW